ncbi:MAG: autotransporter-associated beta strand repeat-containing protein [Verrucomicrobia bacterium]|nr:autotransporter-associated beta strand repeat-containing protein [Verrucomicrobiota bacterium]
MNSGDSGRPARVVHLGDEISDGDDMNIRGGTNMRLDSATEFYLLNTSSRFRVRDNSRIFGTGDLILNPGNAFNFTGEATGQGESIRRELRVENTGRIATTGTIQIHAARLRLIGSADITDTQGIAIHPQGQLMLERTGTVTYDLGNGAILLNSGGHLMDDGSNGAIRQESNTAADLAIINNPVQVLGSSTLHARGEGTLELRGPISGVADGQAFGQAVQLRKSGSGLLRLSGAQTANDSWLGGWDISNGTVELQGDSRLPFAPLRFSSSDNERVLKLNAGQHRISLLDGDAQDPEEPESVNTLTLHLSHQDTELMVDQAMFFSGEEETDTRFQGAITGSGKFTKTGGGILRLTRWAKTFSGETLIEQGVLAVSESAALANTAKITVLSGGQLRLTSSGSDVSYNFGGDLVLNGAGRSGDVSEGQGQGVNGALRLDPGSGATTTTISSPVHLASDATIHVNGADKTLIAEGPISGPGRLTRSGAGSFYIRGMSTLTGGITLDNGYTAFESGAHLAGGDILFRGSTNDATLDLASGTHTATGLRGGFAASSVLLRAGSQLTLNCRQHSKSIFRQYFRWWCIAVRRSGNTPSAWFNNRP